MDDNSQSGTATAPDDEIDFRPAQASKRSAGASSDGIDFQPAQRAPKTPPAALLSVYAAPQGGTPSPSESAARVGGPSPDVRALLPKTADLTAIPRSPFTNELEPSPPMRTEEEKQRSGVIAPRQQTFGERALRAVGAGASEGSAMANLTGQRGVRNPDEMRLIAPEQLMTETEQQRHPILTGAGQFAGGMTSPESLMLIGLTGAAGELAGPGAAVAKRLLSAGFSIPMLVNAARMTPQIADAFRRGDTAEGERLLTQAVLTAGTAGLAGRGMFEEAAPSTVSKGAIGAPLGRDFAGSRADRAAQVNAQAQTGLENVDTAVAQGSLQRVGDRAARRMQDFEANAAARRGMGNLAGAEQGIEAAKLQRINAPVDIPRTYEGPTPILQGRTQGPERNPLEVEAARVRDEQAAKPQDFGVRDLRRVTLGNVGEPQHYDLSPVERPSSNRMVEPAPAGETVGARGRSATMSNLAERVVPRLQNSLVQRFGPDVLDDARQELNAAAGLASSFERPGRYFSQYGDQHAYMPSRSTNAAKGIHASGIWYGVSSARNTIEDMHPWFRNVAEGPETAARIIGEGKGAAYDRMLESAATHIQNERESARPVIEEFAPHLQSLAVQIHDIDPELAGTLHQLASGKAVGFKNLREYIESKIHDAETAATFSQAVEDAAAEARGEAGAEETAEPGSEARAEGRGHEEASGESAHPVAAHGEIEFEPSQPVHPQEVEDLSRQLGRPITAEEIPEIRRRLEAERNVEAGLRGERRDAAGEIREEHRTKLERGEVHEPARPPEGYFPLSEDELDSLSTQLGRPATQADAHLLRRAYDFKKAREEGVLPGMEGAVREQREAAGREQGRQLTERANRPPESIEERAGTMERESPLFRGTEASPQNEMFAQRGTARTFETEYRNAADQLGLEYRGVMGADLGDKAAVVYQDPQSKTSVAVKVGEWSPERLEKKLAQARERMAGGEVSSGPNPKTLVQGAKILSRAWDERVARPLIDKVLKIGDKYQKAREADPAVAEGLHLLDNAPQYLRTKAAQEVHNVVGDLSRAQERLFTLMADSDSRENLRANHPEEYRQAQNDPAVQAALKKYKPLEQQLTAVREKMGGENLDQDYLRRVYDKYVAGVNKPSAEGKPAESAPFDRVIRPQNVNPKSREATAEYHYQNGLHEFGPAFATKFVATHLKGLRDEVAQEFLSKSSLLQNGAEEPRSINYDGKRYFRPDVAREMRDAGVKGTKEYGYYDPTQGEKFPTPAEGRYLGPKEITKALTDYGRKEDSEPGAVRRFFQEQILGFGFGVPHVFNILRRVTQQSPGGAANPQAWVKALKVGLGKELRERGISGLNDPTFDMLAKHGAISTGEVSNLKEYIGGNLNPANWARGVAQIGHKALFEPHSFGGFGGIDQRARLYVADLMRSQRPDLTDTQVSRGVNDALGEYNRANWTDRQKLLGRFMMFPGWDFASLRWILQHPIKTTVPPALVVMLANHALHSFGQNRDEDQNDISAVYVGDRAFSTGLLRESMARNLFRPALNYAQAKARGESNQRAVDEAARGITSGAGGLLNTMRPDLSGFVALATNRESLASGKEIVAKQDYETPGKILPSKALEKQAVFAARRALPALDRMIDSNEDVDLRSFVGGNLGLPNYRDDAEKRLIRDTAEAERVYQRVGKLAKTDPEQARQFLKDPDNATYALFYRDLAGMTKMLNRIDQAKQEVEGGKLSDPEKQSRLQAIEKARANVLSHADGLNRMLFERRAKTAPQVNLPSWLAPKPSSGLQPIGGPR
jgi:hypothetical protein